MHRELLLACAFFFMTQPSQADGLDNFLARVRVQAKNDSMNFSAQLALQFGVPQAQVQMVLGKVHDPADAFMIFQMGHMTQRPCEHVLDVYQSHRKQGWGAMAKAMGIKPGSKAFHAMKAGRFDYDPEGRGHKRVQRDDDGHHDRDMHKDKGHGKEKGHGKGKGKGK